MKGKRGYICSHLIQRSVITVFKTKASEKKNNKHSGMKRGKLKFNSTINSKSKFL